MSARRIKALRLKFTTRAGRQCLVRACVTLLLALSGGGCSERYAMERLFWQAERAAQTVIQHAGGVSSYEFDRAVALFENVIKQAGVDSDFAFNAQLRIAQLYRERKEFDKARTIQDAAINSRPGRQELIAKALFQKGQTYETEGDWPAALAVFKQILDSCSDTQEAVSVPLYIARYYAQRGDSAAAEQAYRASVQYFQQMAAKHPNSKTSLLAENMVIRTYIEMEDWPVAVQYIEQLDTKYRLGPDTLFLLGQIYENRLKDTAKAQVAYERIIATWPDSRVAELAKQRLLSLRDGKVSGTNS